MQSPNKIFLTLLFSACLIASCATTQSTKGKSTVRAGTTFDVATYYYPSETFPGMGSAYSSLDDLPQAKQQAPSGVQYIVNVGYYPDASGLPGSLSFGSQSDGIKSGIKDIHANGGKVVIAFGGWGKSFSAFPVDDSGQFYETLYNTVKSFGFDGIDFDDENVASGNRDESLLLFALPKLRQIASSDNNPGFIISFAGFMSGAAGGWGNFLNVLQNSKVQSSITYVNVMDYEDTSKWHYGGKCTDYTVPSSVSALINTKTSSGDYANCYLGPLSDYASALGGNNPKIMMGMMIGQQSAAASGVDPSQVLSPDNIKVMTQYAQQVGYAGIQYWDSSRDTQNSDFHVGTNYPTGAYFNAVMQALTQPQK